jgi:hypothetical protein
MVAMPHDYQVGDFVRVKTEEGPLIGQPSDDVKGKSGKILRRYPASTRRISAIWWVGFGEGTPEPIAEEWLEPELNE